MDFIIAGPHDDPFERNKRYFDNALSEYVYYSKYARWRSDLGRREVWEETVTRTVDYLRELSEGGLRDDDYRDMYDAILRMEVMPSMRLMAMAGDAARREPVSAYNCAALPIDSLNSIVEVMYLSMNGVGIGFSVERQFTDRLAKIERQHAQSSGVLNHRVEDSTEGWCDAFKLGLQTWFNGGDIVFDYSGIRPAGAPLMTKGGTASGFLPLKELLDFTRDIVIRNQGERLHTIDVYDVVTKIADCVVMGGVRRTAFLALFDFDDEEMLRAKNDEWWTFAPHRANANNSAVWDRELSRGEIAAFFDVMDDGNNGEPGIFSRRAVMNALPERRSRDSVYGTNACVTGDTLVAVADGRGAVRFDELVKDGKDVLVYAKDDHGNAVARTMRNPRQTGVKPVYRVIFDDGNYIDATEDHKFMCKDGVYRQVKDLVGGEHVAVLHRYTAPMSCLTKKLRHTVVSVEWVGVQAVYNGTVDEYHNYYVGGWESLTKGGKRKETFVNCKNCGEAVLPLIRDEDGGGGGLCNLSSIVARAGDTLNVLMRKARVAAMIGTVQSMATEFGYLRPGWKRSAEHERLLGVDLTGQFDCAAARLPDNQTALRNEVVATNRWCAQRLGINASVATTAVKPSGNSGALLNVSSGVHPRWSRYYVRNVRVNRDSPFFYVLEDCGVPLIKENEKTFVVGFPTRAPHKAITRHQIGAIQHLEYWKQTKMHYAQHSVSCTVYYAPYERADVKRWIWRNQMFLTGVSFLPRFDAHYENAPFVEIDEDEFNRRVASFPTVDYARLQYYDNSAANHSAQEVACSADKCELAL